MRFTHITSIVLGVALAIPFAQTTRGETATQTEMETVCNNWLSYMVYQQGDWAGETEPKITAVQELVVEGTLLGRCFTIAPRGHVVVPILKELPPIKAYSDECNLDFADSDGLPQLLRDVLADRANMYVEKYGSLDAIQPNDGDILLDPKHRRQWDRLLVDADQFNSDVEAGVFITLDEAGPLLTSNWHQSGPYNDTCPMGFNGTDPVRAVVGCVATAAAQLLNYHEWPPSGVGGHNYYWDGDDSCTGSSGENAGNITVDFSDAYDWANILNHYIWNDVELWYEDEFGTPCTEAQLDAVAELCHEVGVAYEMDYGACGSGANTNLARVIFPRHFRYAPGINTQKRSDYTAEDWFAIIQQEINASRPMLYTIPGHAIVCDGWRDTGPENEYHMNYGWASSHTTWYTVDELLGGNPLAEQLIRNIQPWQPGDPDCNDNGILDYEDIWEGTSADCNENMYPDECDIALGTSEDCQPDGVPDECQLLGPVGPPDYEYCSHTATDGAPWCDDFETYDPGSIQGLNGWQGWGPDGGNPDAAGTVTTEQNHTPGGSKSLKIEAHDTVHVFSGYDLDASRFWVLSAWVYIPSDMAGTAFLILNPDYDGGEAETTWSVTLEMNTAAGTIHSSDMLTSLALLTDQWAEIRLGINFVQDSVTVYYDGALLATHPWSMGGGSPALGAVDLFSPDSTGFYYDDLALVATMGNDLNDNGIPDECDTDVAIPAVSEWGLAAMTLLVLTAASVVFTRRRAAA